jgi:hypothetical protein
MSYFNEYSLFAATFYMRVEGATLLLFMIFHLRMLKVNDFEKFKIYYEFGLLWILANTGLNIYGLATLPTVLGGTIPATLLSSVILNTVILAAYGAIYLYYYLQQVRG